MRKILVAFAAASLLMVAVVASAFGSTGSASSAPPSLKASASPTKAGYYYGIECGQHSCDYYNESREAAKYYCGTVFHLPGFHGTYSPDFHGYSLVCLKLDKTGSDGKGRLLSEFWVNEDKIASSIHVSSDRFPETGNGGWDVQGEWFGTSTVQGYFKNPNKVKAYYKAEWFAS